MASWFMGLSRWSKRSHERAPPWDRDYEVMKDMG